MILGSLLIRDTGFGTRPYIKWEDGTEDDIHCGDVITLRDGREFRMEMSRDDRWYLVRYGYDIEGLICRKDD